MKKLILAVLTAFLLIGCSTFKKLNKKEDTKQETSVIRKEITRPGDTITIDIPNIRYKDTTITRINYENKTIASVRYDDQGNQQFECLSAEIKEKFEQIDSKLEIQKEEETEKKSEFKPQHLIYAIAGLGLVVVLIMVVFMILMAKIQKSIPQTIISSLKDVVK